MKQFFKMAVITSALVGVAGCQSTGQSTESVAIETNAPTAAATTFESLQKQYVLDKAIFDSLDDFKVYSEPAYTVMMDNWIEAKEIFADIEKEPSLLNEEYSMFSSGSYSSKYMTLVAAADVELSKLKNYKETADVVLSDAIAQMAYMNSIDVKAYYSQEFSNLNNDYNQLFITVIEDGIAEAQTHQASFLTKAKVIEIETTLKIHVRPLEKEFSGLTNKGFKTIAPISYGQTKAELDKTKKAVQANNRDQALIVDVVAKTRFQLDHLKNMAAEVKLLKAVKNGEFEQSVLEVENKLLSISQATNGDDYRDEPLRTQTSSILKAIQQMHDINNTTDLEAKIKDLNAQIKTLEVTVENQTSDRVGVQKQVLVLTQQLERNDNLINNLNGVIASYKEKEEASTVGHVQELTLQAPLDTEVLVDEAPAVTQEPQPEVVVPSIEISATDKAEVDVVMPSTQVKVVADVK